VPFLARVGPIKGQADGRHSVELRVGEKLVLDVRPQLRSHRTGGITHRFRHRPFVSATRARRRLVATQTRPVGRRCGSYRVDCGPAARQRSADPPFQPGAEQRRGGTDLLLGHVESDATRQTSDSRAALHHPRAPSSHGHRRRGRWSLPANCHHPRAGASDHQRRRDNPAPAAAGDPLAVGRAGLIGTPAAAMRRGPDRGGPRPTQPQAAPAGAAPEAGLRQPRPGQRVGELRADQHLKPTAFFFQSQESRSRGGQPMSASTAGG